MTSTDRERPFVSHGDLPREELIRALVDEAHTRYVPDREGTVSDVYPALERVPPDLFGIAVSNVRGLVYPAGDAEHPFTP